MHNTINEVKTAKRNEVRKVFSATYSEVNLSPSLKQYSLKGAQEQPHY